MRNYLDDVEMIDIHSHILPMVDDGASSVETALNMLDDAYCDGTTEIVLTPHYAPAYGYINQKSKIHDLVSELKFIVENEGIPIKIHSGCEYLIQSPRRFYEDIQNIATLNHSRYLLTEFYFDAQETEILNGIAAIQEQNLIPILAHPERYECIQRYPENVKYYIQGGALLQMNKGSVLGEYGKAVQNTAMKILAQNGYAFAGSDAHHAVERNTHMYLAYKFVCDYFGAEYAREIFSENPKKMLKDKDI